MLTKQKEKWHTVQKWIKRRQGKRKIGSIIYLKGYSHSFNKSMARKTSQTTIQNRTLILTSMKMKIIITMRIANMTLNFIPCLKSYSRTITFSLRKIVLPSQHKKKLISGNRLTIKRMKWHPLQKRKYQLYENLLNQNLNNLLSQCRNNLLSENLNNLLNQNLNNPLSFHRTTLKNREINHQAKFKIKEIKRNKPCSVVKNQEGGMFLLEEDKDDCILIK